MYFQKADTDSIKKLKYTACPQSHDLLLNFCTLLTKVKTSCFAVYFLPWSFYKIYCIF